MKHLVLHIGANKTGSSAIQEFLRLNADALPRFGLHVAPSDLQPGGAVTGQHVWFMEQQLADIPAGRRRITNRIARLMADLKDEERLLISAENLANPTGAERMFVNTAKEYDTRVILYIRRQDELLLSSWQQWESKITDDFWAWLTLGVGTRGDWRDILQAWEKIMPREKITVRLYERPRMQDGDVVADFASVLGLSDRLGELQRPAGAINPSYADALVELVKGNTAVFRDKHDNDFYNMVEQLTGDRYHRNPRESVITFEQRSAILERYRESNEWVRARYFADTPVLFEPPTEADYVLLSPSKLSKQKSEIVSSLLFTLAKRVLAEE
ncbi:MAG: sulfotransferase domain-containing protein [Alphaproteobacteria bacterium]|nr:sulfotransferase domain-containing protein [Alphaproteobacteria bacterium]